MGLDANAGGRNTIVHYTHSYACIMLKQPKKHVVPNDHRACSKFTRHTRIGKSKDRGADKIGGTKGRERRDYGSRYNGKHETNVENGGGDGGGEVEDESRWEWRRGNRRNKTGNARQTRQCESREGNRESKHKK